MKLDKSASIKSIIYNHPDRTTNYEGGVAFKMPPMERLYTRVASCLIKEHKFYKETDEGGLVAENQDELLLADIQEVAKTDPEFILKLAEYARNGLNLRSVSIVLLVEASLIPACKPFVRKYAPRIIRRADELAEATAYLQTKVGHLGNKRDKGSMPSALKRGLADAFHNFEEYHFAKYDRDGAVKLKDVLKLVHPKPKDKAQSGLFKRISERTLKVPDTWEVAISTKGSTKESWEKIAPKMPFMALLRNLRNFHEHDVDMRPILAKLTDPEIVRKSRQFPFRFLSAYRELEEVKTVGVTKTLDALETAMDISAENLPRLDGATLLIADVSGSMDAAISAKSKVTMKDISTLMLSLAHKLCDSPITMAFGTDAEIINLSQRNGVISNMRHLREEGERLGGSTEAWKTLDLMMAKKLKVDRIILFSDMQCYNSTDEDMTGEEYRYTHSFAGRFLKYKRTINPKVKLYSIDLSGYGTLQTPKEDACLIAGWSDRILEFIDIFEKDKKGAIEIIKAGSWRKVKHDDKEGKERMDDTHTDNPS